MFVYAGRLRSRICDGLIRRCATTSPENSVKEKWDLISSVCLERTPITTRELNPLETQYSRLLSSIEFEKSHKSNFEIKTIEDKKRAKKIKESGEILSGDGVPLQTYQDFLDACNAELNEFQLAPRVGSEADEAKSSSLRAMDRRLVLLVQEKLGVKTKWILPQGLYQGEGSLKATAERVLQEKCPGVVARFLGNAPAGFYKYKYPKSLHYESVGAKVFFFKAQLVRPYSKPEHQWATRAELTVLPEDYLKSIRMFLIDEEH